MNRLIAVVGMCGSGKSIACELLTQVGFQKVYFGGVIYDKMREAGIEITPESQKEFRENLRKQYGMGVVATLLLPKIKQLYQQGDVVLDGLYSWEEYKILKKEFPSLVVISLVVDKKIRYQRIKDRLERPFTYSQTETRDISEIENSAKGGPIAFADYYLFNNGDLTAYQNRLQEIINSIKNGSEWINEKND